jgi:hypothetical protein
MTSNLIISARMLASGSAMLVLSSGMALAQSATPTCIGSQNTDCVPSDGVNAVPPGMLRMENRNRTMTPGETPNGLRSPGSTGVTNGINFGSRTSAMPNTGGSVGMGMTPGIGGGASGGRSGGTMR